MLLCFIPKSKLTKYSKFFEGMLAQVIVIRPGHSFAVIILCMPKKTIKQMVSHNKPDNKDTMKSLYLKLKTALSLPFLDAFVMVAKVAMLFVLMMEQMKSLD